jgi:hypothetical protein
MNVAALIDYLNVLNHTKYGIMNELIANTATFLPR